ncbi:hypothetical protein D3C73_643590 [compost metagenome]
MLIEIREARLCFRIGKSECPHQQREKLCPRDRVPWIERIAANSVDHFTSGQGFNALLCPSHTRDILEGHILVKNGIIAKLVR